MVNAQTVAMITVGRATEGRGSVPATIKAWGALGGADVSSDKPPGCKAWGHHLSGGVDGHAVHAKPVRPVSHKSPSGAR